MSDDNKLEFALLTCEMIRQPAKSSAKSLATSLEAEVQCVRFVAQVNLFAHDMRNFLVFP